MPRLFTALEIPSSLAMHLSLLQSGLAGARWIERDSLHLTLRFIGDVEMPFAREIASALEKVKTPPFTLRLSGLDVFGNSKPHSLYAGISRSDALIDLQAEQERICQRVGLAPEPRKFKPHVTIARIRGAKTPGIAKYLSRVGGFESQPFTVGRIVLLSSRASTGGGPYVTEESYQLVEQTVVQA